MAKKSKVESVGSEPVVEAVIADHFLRVGVMIGDRAFAAIWPEFPPRADDTPYTPEQLEAYREACKREAVLLALHEMGVSDAPAE